MFENTCLKGLRVLDVTRFLAGPTTCQILSDLGADVWKIERVGVGDDGRTFAPFKEGESGWYHAFNRNKRSITLDYTKPEGREVFYELVKQCDVLVENNAAGVMKKYHLDYESVIEHNPGIVYASISGYGQKDSPYVNFPAFDGVAQAFGGLIALNGREDQPGMKVGVGVIDLISGYMATIGVLGALYEREKSGKGQHIDTCMVDACLNFTENAVTYYSFTGESMARCGNGHPSIGLTGCFDTLEGKDKINPYLLAAISANLFSLILGSATSSINLSMQTLGEVFLQYGVEGYNVGFMHRILSQAAMGLDTLPHCDALLAVFNVCGTNHKMSYKYVGFCTVLCPIFVTFCVQIPLCILLT